MSVSRLCMLSVVAGLLPAQRVELPGDTGGVTGTLAGAPDWVALTATELAMSHRESDPNDEPARSLLRAWVAELQAQQRTGQHVVLHQPGQAAGTIRLVHAYSADVRATAEDLSTDRAVETVRQAFEPTLRAPGVEVRYLGHDDPQLFAVGSLVLRFELAGGGARWRVDHHLVPAGERVQYFEALHFVDDTGGEHAIEILLRSFDGAREVAASRLWRNVLIGGLAGGIAGILSARRRQRRRQQLLAAADAPPERR